MHGIADVLHGMVDRSWQRLVDPAGVLVEDDEGVAGALVLIRPWLRDEGGHVLSGTSPANRASIQWHWRHGFVPVPDPFATLHPGAKHR